MNGAPFEVGKQRWESKGGKHVTLLSNVAEKKNGMKWPNQGKEQASVLRRHLLDLERP